MGMTSTSPRKRMATNVYIQEGSYFSSTNGLNAAREDLSVDRPVDTQRRDKAGRTHRAQEGRRFPTTVGNLGPEPRTLRATAVGTSHVRLSPGFVDKHQPVRVDRKLRGSPLSTRLDYVFTLLLSRNERLFFRVRFSARQARLSVTSETSQPSSSLAAACNSRK